MSIAIHSVLRCVSVWVGAVLSHKMANGEERPMGFASRTLTATELKYSQLDKEALAIVFGIKKYL